MKRLPLRQKAASATFVSALLCASLLWSPSCSTPPLTEIIVTVDSTFPEGELDTVRLIIVRDGESRIVTVDLADESPPFTQGVVHRGGSFDISISAQGFSQERLIVEQLVPVERFVEGESVRVRVELNRSCIGVMCGAGNACVEGTCVSTSMDAGVQDAGVFDARPLVDALADGTLEVPGECPTARTDIEGEFVCAADCDDCNVRCKRADCRVTCRSGATCNVEASGGPRAIVECERGSTCNLKTKKQGSLTARCLGSTCDIDCDADSTCDVTCDDSSCEANCGDNPGCRLQGDCTVEDCGNRLVCGRECP